MKLENNSQTGTIHHINPASLARSNVLRPIKIKAPQASASTPSTNEVMHDLGMTDSAVAAYEARFKPDNGSGIQSRQKRNLDFDTTVRTPCGGTSGRATGETRVSADPLFATCSDCKARSLGFCGNLDAETLLAVRSKSVNVRTARRSSLFTQGEWARKIYIVKSGAIRLSRNLPDGRRQVTGFALTGDLIGLDLNDQYLMNGDVIDDASFCAIPRAAFFSIADTNRSLSKLILTSIMHDLSVAQDQLVSLGKQNAQQRVATLIVQLQNRWHVIENASVHVSLPMTRADIADYCGLSMETVSRAISMLVRQRAIAIVPEGIRILNARIMDRMALGLANLS